MELMQVFILLLSIFVIALFALIVTYVVLVIKNKRKEINNQENNTIKESGKSEATKNK